jgi:putative alpha-1,2-mannosidase
MEIHDGQTISNTDLEHYPVVAESTKRRCMNQKIVAFLLLVCTTALGAQKSPVNWVNTLVGTAPLDKQKLIGNAPPPGELLYTGMTSPGPVLPHGGIDLAPINNNVALSYPAGVPMSYDYLFRTMIGFSSAMPGMVVMPVVGPWTVPPERIGSVYDRSSQIATPGYYSVYLQDSHIKAEMTVTYWTGMYRFTFPESNHSHLLMDMGPGGGAIEISDGHTVRGCGERWLPGSVSGTRPFGTAQTCFVAVFSRPFKSFGTFREEPPSRPGRYSFLGDKKVTRGGKTESGPYAGAYLNFDTSEGEAVLIKIAAADNYQDAQQRLETYNPGWDFDAIHQQAVKIWATLQFSKQCLYSVSDIEWQTVEPAVVQPRRHRQWWEAGVQHGSDAE